MEHERDFKGVWFPKEIWFDTRINALDKMILLEIDSLDKDEKGCYASNEYLGNFCQCSPSKVSYSVNKLIQLGYLELISFNGRERCLRSLISLPSKIWEADYQNLLQRYIKRNNNISNDILFKEKKSLEDEIEGLKKELETLKKKKKRETKPFTKPTVEEIAEYCLERQNNINPKNFFTYYDVADWKDTNGKPVKNWKQRIISWENKEEPTLNVKPKNVPGWVGQEIEEKKASEEEIKALEELLDNDGLRNRKTN